MLVQLKNRVLQFAQNNTHILSRMNTASKMASLVALLVVIPAAIDKPKDYQTAIKFDQTSANPLVATDKTVRVVTVPSRVAVNDASRSLDPQVIKSLIQSIAPEYGVDWKFVYAIGYLESGYNSSLARRNFNFFGRKASSHSWMKYSDPEAGIRDQFAYLKEHYINRGLDTPAEIGPIYCEGNTWAGKVNSIMHTL